LRAVHPAPFPASARAADPLAPERAHGRWRARRVGGRRVNALRAAAALVARGLPGDRRPGLVGLCRLATWVATLGDTGLVRGRAIVAGTRERCPVLRARACASAGA